MSSSAAVAEIVAVQEPGTAKPIASPALAPRALDLSNEPAYDSLPTRACGPIVGMMSPQIATFGEQAGAGTQLTARDVSEMSKKDGDLCHCVARFGASGEKEGEGSGEDDRKGKEEKQE